LGQPSAHKLKVGPYFFHELNKYFMRNSLFNLNLSLFLALPLAFGGPAAAQANSGDAVATVAGQPISEQELIEAVGPQQVMQLRTQEYETKSKTLENLIRLKLVQAEAGKRGISAEKLIEQDVESKVADPTDSEVEAYFWGQNREGVRFEDVKYQYRAALKRLKILKARQVYADSLKGKIDVAVLLRPPSVDVTYDASRVKGDPQAPVTIVEFSDFQCPFCRKTESTLNDLLTKYKGRVKLAYMDFPLLEIHSQAQKAAEAARCAGEQGKFWGYHDALYADQTKLSEAELLTHARTMNLDEKSFQSCLTSGKFKSKVEADLEQGKKAGVAGTPGFFINGVFLSGAQPLAEFEKIIDNQLALLGARHSSSDR
jgi:protein-disulfide isomerase